MNNEKNDAGRGKQHTFCISLRSNIVFGVKVSILCVFRQKQNFMAWDVIFSFLINKQSLIVKHILLLVH